MTNASSFFLVEAARGLLISFTTYSVRTDWWAYNYVLYEYGANEEVILSQVRSYPFRPNIYESTLEKHLFIIDIIRIAGTLLVFMSLLIYKVTFFKLKSSIDLQLNKVKNQVDSCHGIKLLH